MGPIITEILVNIVGNIFAWVFLGILTMILIRHRSQKRFEEFFGLAYKKKVVVFLSNLWDPKMKITQKPPEGIIAGEEFKATHVITRLFGTAPFRLPDLVRGFIDTFWIGRKVIVQFETSPMEEWSDGCDNLIVIGASLKNSVRLYYAKTNTLHVIIEGEPKDISKKKIDIYKSPLTSRLEIISGSHPKRYLEQDEKFEPVIIEKVKEKNKTIIFCLGRTGIGSRAAIEYLAHDWKKLWVNHKDSCFASCLWFLKSDINGPSPSWEPTYSENIYAQESKE
jgi:hypothetical protein